MRLVKPSVPTPKGRGGYARTRAKPQWLKEWIEDKPDYVELTCRHKDRLNIRGQLITKIFGEIQVFCETCNEFRGIRRHIKMREYHGIPAVDIPDEPLF